jgi:hypothetical protein
VAQSELGTGFAALALEQAVLVRWVSPELVVLGWKWLGLVELALPK